MSAPTVVTVLRASRVYTPEYVVRLFDGIRAHTTEPVDFLCLTDTPIDYEGIRIQHLRHDWPGYWCKLELFRPDLAADDVLFFDLDTMFCGPLSDVFAVERHAMLRRIPRRFRHNIASGMMRLPAAVRPVIWDRWTKDPALFMRRHRPKNEDGLPFGDQGFLQETWQRHGLGRESLPGFDYAEWHRRGIARWQMLLPGQIESYKLEAKPRGGIGPDTRVLLFHGRPRPHEIGWNLPPRRQA